MRFLPIAPSRRALGPLAFATLSLGYADLVRGGVTAGPVLLLAGYLVLIPALLLVDADA